MPLVRIVYDGSIVVLERWKAAKRLLAVKSRAADVPPSEGQPEITPLDSAA